MWGMIGRVCVFVGVGCGVVGFYLICPPQASIFSENKKGVFRGLPGLVGSSKYRKWTQRTEIFLWVDFQSLARRIRRNPPSPGKSKFHDNWVKGS